MHASECLSYTEVGCAVHGQPDCLCDVRPIEAGVPIRAVPFAERLLVRGVSGVSFAAWAEEIRVWQEEQRGLHLVGEA